MTLTDRRGVAWRGVAWVVVSESDQSQAVVDGGKGRHTDIQFVLLSLGGRCGAICAPLYFFSFCLLIHYYIPMFGVSTNTDRLLGLCSHVVAFASASLARRRVLRASRTRSGCTSAREGVQMIEMSQVKW